MVKFLIKNEEKYYTISDSALSEIKINELSLIK